MKTRSLLICLLFLSLSSPLLAQIKDFVPSNEQKNVYYISGRGTYGYIIPTNDFLKGDNFNNEKIQWMDAQALSFGVQTTGNKEWQHVLNFPYYGASVYTTGVHGTNEMGRPIAFYGFLGIPIKRKQNYNFGYELSLGLATNWKEYDKFTNPNNITIGSNTTVYIGANLYWDFQLDERWKLKTGFGFTHFSNGAIKKPNKGMNVVAPFIELAYSLADAPELERQLVPEYEPHKELAVQFSYAMKQEEFDSSDPDVAPSFGDFEVYNISVSRLKQTTWKHKWGYGADVSINTQGNVSTSQQPDGEVLVHKSDKFSDKFMLGAYGTYEFCINRLSIASSLGVYLYRKDYDTAPPLVYQRIGVKYYLPNDIYLGMLVRAHNFSVADMLEWTIGYRIKW